ncbi:transposase [Streptomyces broussonetiae]|uniref:transposase n=1 Tax=Streptomyces broussonetiae TaxID=2686304 RepID=UPI0035E2174F
MGADRTAAAALADAVAGAGAGAGAARLDPRVRGRLPRAREKGGAATGPSPVDRRKTGSKHHLICDGKGTPLHVITTAANVDDVTRTLDLVDGIPPVAGRPGRPRRRPECLLGDEAYDSLVASPAATTAASSGRRGIAAYRADRDGWVPKQRPARPERTDDEPDEGPAEEQLDGKETELAVEQAPAR